MADLFESELSVLSDPAAISSINDAALTRTLRHRMANKTMPAGSLGRLDDLAVQLGLIQRTPEPCFDAQCIVVFAGDHGIADRGVSAYPKSVTWQMVRNFLTGGAAINVLCRANGIELRVVDSGIDHDFNGQPGLIHAKLANGTADFSRGAAMTEPQCHQAVQVGARITDAVLRETGADLIGFGEMGIGNSSSAAALTARLLNVPIDACVGRGTGISDEVHLHKRQLLREALKMHAQIRQPIDLLACLGGFEIAMIVGGMLTAARQRKGIVIDGYIVTSALLVARQLAPAVQDYCIFSHRSTEPGHSLALSALGARPLLDLDLRLGEASGAALAMPLIRSAARVMREMASFDEAQVAQA